MEKLFKVIHNAETNEIVEVELSKDELIELQNEDNLKKEKIAAEKAAVIQKNALLEKLGITADEAKLLLS